MGYKVVKYFTDLQDSGHAYHVGDSFPRNGMVVSENRIKALLSGNNRRGEVLIEEIKEEAKIDLKSSNEAKPKKTTRKSTKKEKVNKNAE